MGLTSSRGKRPSRLHSSMIGMRFSSMKRRAVSRTRRSSSVSRESNSMKSTPLNLKTGIFSSSVGPIYCRTSGRVTQRAKPAQGRLPKLAEANRTVKPPKSVGNPSSFDEHFLCNVVDRTVLINDHEIFQLCAIKDRVQYRHSINQVLLQRSGFAHLDALLHRIDAGSNATDLRVC